MLKTVGNPASRTGDQTILNGNLVIGTAGNGIDFSADPHAAGMTSELLDDYEEGDWTPAVTAVTGTFGGVSGTGTYTRIGRTIYIDYNILISGNGTAAEAIIVNGLPYAASPYRAFGNGAESDAVGFNTVSQIIGATTFFYLSKVDGAYAGGNGYRLQGSLTYKV
jgi:hypothetical protein